MENLEQIITKQNNIREKINEYNRDFELYNKTYIEKFTELKTLKNELKYEKNSVQKDDDKIKILHFKIQSMSIEISSMANKVKEIQTNINDMKLEQEQLKEELLENPEVKIAVYAEEKRRVQELKDAKILEKREIDTLLKNNPKDISEIPNNIAEKISKDSLFQKYDSQISNFTELLNNSSNPRAKSSLENKIKTLEKEKEEFLISKIKEIASEYQNSIHIYEKELQTLAVKEAKVILDRHNGVYNGTSKVKDQKVFDDSKNNTSKTSDEKETKTDQSNNKDESQQTDTKSKDENDENDENTNNSKNDINDPSDNSDFKSKIMEEDIKNLPKKIGFFDKFKEKFSKVKEWLKDQFDNFKLTTVPMPEKNAKNDGPEVNTDEKGNTKNKKDETETQNKEEKKQEKEKEKEQQEQKQNDDSSKNMNNTDTENNKEEEKTEKENSKETEDNREYTNSNYTQKEILDNEDIRKKIEDYMNNLEKKQKNNSNKEKENSTRESKEKEEI
jgi:hypothetical protein